MSEWIPGLALAAAIFGWLIAGMIALGFIPAAQRWLKEPGNSVRLWLWTGAAALVTLTLISSDDSFFGKFRYEAISIALTVIVIDELNRHRANREFKEATIRQLASRSNDFALDAARIVVEKGWHNDGSLVGVSLKGANLAGAKLNGSNLEGTSLIGANLSDAILVDTNLAFAELKSATLTGAILIHADLMSAQLDKANLAGANLLYANLQDATLFGTRLENAILGLPNFMGDLLFDINLEGALYSVDTTWPKGFDPRASGARLLPKTIAN